MPEAKLCRFCNRTTLYSVVLTGSLDDKQSHQFLKIWQGLDKKSIRHLPLSNYSLARTELSKVPKTLAWDLSLSESESVTKSLKGLPLESKIQTGLPSTFLTLDNDVKPKHSIASFMYGILFLLALAAGSIPFLKNPEPTEPAGHIKVEILDDDRAPSRNSKEPLTAPPHLFSEPGKNFGRSDMEHLLNAAVFIRDNSSLGSGFFITSDGYLLSNAHVTSPMTEPIVVLRDGRKFPATKIKEDTRLDAALLKVPVTNVDFLNLGNANDLYPGQPVITIGNPGGLSFTVTRGIVSYLGRVISGVPFIQTDAAINRGNSGGPMINENLEVVGINSMTSLGEQGISFALPINLVCGSQGISEGISTTPRHCESLKVNPDQITPANLERQKPDGRKHSSESSALYQSEVDALKGQLSKRENEFIEESNRLQARINEIQSNASADPSNYSKQQSAKQEIEELNKSVAEIPKKRAEAQIRYLRQVIDVLERQRGDPDFSQLSNQIAQQIDSLNAQIKGLENATR